jgi:hypothetical protein
MPLERSAALSRNLKGVSNMDDKKKQQANPTIHANDSMTTFHIEQELLKKSLTTAHISQALASNPAKGSNQTEQPAAGTSPKTQSDGKGQ